GLPASACGGTLAGHQLRRHPDHRLSMGEEVAFEQTGEVTAVLQPPSAVLLDELLPGPAVGLLVTVVGRADSDLPDLLARRVDRDEGVWVLVDVSADQDHHGHCLP